MPNPQSPIPQSPDSVDTINDTPKRDTAKKTATKKPLEKPKKTNVNKLPQTIKHQPPSATEFMATEYKGISIYGMAMVVLIGLILWTGIAAVQQVQAYHQQYGVLQQLKKDYRQLQIENQRLLIEQQTFSATPQIASRAVAELNMFYPQLSDRMIIQADNLTSRNANTAMANRSPTIAPVPTENGRVSDVYQMSQPISQGTNR